MATGPSPSMADETLRATDEKANFQRLTRLLMCGGLALLRELFDSIHPPARLPNVLGYPSIKKKLKLLKGDGVLSYPEWESLYNPRRGGKYGKSADFDVSLLCKLLRSICNLSPPVTGWNKLPDSADESLAADLVRIKIRRNSIYAHNRSMEISGTDFEKLWTEVSEALLRIASHMSIAKRNKWKKSVENFYHDPLTPDAQEYVLQLRMWYNKDMDTKDEVSKLTNEVAMMRDEQKQMKIILHTIAVHFEGDTPLQSDSVPVPPEQPPTQGSARLPRSTELQESLQNRPVALDFWDVVFSFKQSFHLLFKYLKKRLGVDVQDSRLGSLIITVSCSSLEILEALWKDYRTGHLNEVIQDTLVTAEVLKKLDLREVKLRTIISEEDYLSYKHFLKYRSGKGKEKISQAQRSPSAKHVAGKGKEKISDAQGSPAFEHVAEKLHLQPSQVVQDNYMLTTGYVLMINNFSDQPPRQARVLQSLFMESFGFKLREHDHLTKRAMLKELTYTAERDFSDYDSFWCVIRSDGTKDAVCGSDGKVIKPEIITSLFSPDQCPSLKGKPKIFVIENRQTVKGSDSGIPQRPVISEDDFLVWYCIIPDSHFELGDPYPTSMFLNSLNLRDLEEAIKWTETEFPVTSWLVSTLKKKVLLQISF